MTSFNKLLIVQGFQSGNFLVMDRKKGEKYFPRLQTVLGKAPFQSLFEDKETSFQKEFGDLRVKVITTEELEILKKTLGEFSKELTHLQKEEGVEFMFSGMVYYDREDLQYIISERDDGICYPEHDVHLLGNCSCPQYNKCSHLSSTILCNQA